ncbi:polysaccharide deacetylase family protein, partial [Patescibacteria group bacterium]
MYWINFLHFYQPPTMEREIVEKAANESYRFILDKLEEYPDFKVTINICGTLTETLDKYGYGGFLKRLKKLVKKKQVELTSSAAFHPFFPMMPESEILYQIETNNAINKKYFGKLYKPSGFFIPEMAYNKKIAKVISQWGYKWTILDDIHLGGVMGNVNYNKGHIIKGMDLKVIFRRRKISKSYVPEKVLEMLKNSKMPRNLITATDGELYGHHYRDQNGYLTEILQNKEIETITVSEFFKKIKIWEEVDLVNASWESSEKEIKSGEPYILWNNSHNKIQKELWKLAILALKTANNHKSDINYGWARDHLNKGLASCTFWWAAGRDFKSCFGPISWS